MGAAGYIRHPGQDAVIERDAIDLNLGTGLRPEHNGSPIRGEAKEMSSYPDGRDPPCLGALGTHYPDLCPAIPIGDKRDLLAVRRVEGIGIGFRIPGKLAE